MNHSKIYKNKKHLYLIKKKNQKTKTEISEKTDIKNYILNHLNYKLNLLKKKQWKKKFMLLILTVNNLKILSTSIQINSNLLQEAREC